MGKNWEHRDKIVVVFSRTNMEEIAGKKNCNGMNTKNELNMEGSPNPESNFECGWT